MCLAGRSKNYFNTLHGIMLNIAKPTKSCMLEGHQPHGINFPTGAQVINLSIKTMQPYDCCSPAPCPRQVSAKMIFGLSQSWESCVSMLKSRQQRDRTHPRPCLVLHECWQNLEDPEQRLCVSLQALSAAPQAWEDSSLPFANCFPPRPMRGPSHEAPLQPEGCCSTTRCAGGNLPIRCHGTWSINCSQVSWRGGLLSDRCRFMQRIKVVTENLCQASDDFHCK